MTGESFVWLLAVFFFIAVVYSMVGFGGGSSYLAVLAMMGFGRETMAPIALVCNILVAAGSWVHFVRGGHFKYEKVFPFLVLSIPMAYWGGTLSLSKRLFFLLLGLSLVMAALRMFLPDSRFEHPKEVSSAKQWFVGLPVGGVLGFFSGLVGIGGGIFLSPILLFLRWAHVKEAAASASFFIVANSLAGLAGHFRGGAVSVGMQEIMPLAAVVIAGGQIGSRMGSYHLPKTFLRRVLAVLIGMVALKMIWSGVVMV